MSDKLLALRSKKLPVGKPKAIDGSENAFYLARLEKLAQHHLLTKRRIMKNLRRLGAAVALTLALGISTFAGDTQTPPCAPPGSTETPPCASAQVTVDDSVVPGDTMTPPALSSETEYSIAEATVDLLMNVLFLF